MEGVLKYRVFYDGGSYNTRWSMIAGSYNTVWSVIEVVL